MEALTNHPVYQQIIKDSFGGVMYNVANRDKYDISELMEIWNSINEGERESAGGIVNGAISFVTSKR